MGKKEIAICDGCGEECQYYFEIKDGMLKAANGAKFGKSMGYKEVKIENRIFCSHICFQYWFEEKSTIERSIRDDLHFPGNQKGVQSVNGRILNK